MLQTVALTAAPVAATAAPAFITPPIFPRAKPAVIPVPLGAKRVRGLIVVKASPDWKLDGVKPRLVQMLIEVQRHYGRPLHIISGCRSKSHNRKVGGAKRSQHLHCKAADFKIAGVSKYKLAAFLRRLPGRGGVGVYCRSSYVHLDIGPRREWHHGCRKRKKRRTRTQYAAASTSRVSRIEK
ncbi:MAG: YcbK family protein [Hyphomicrobiales bacterium]